MVGGYWRMGEELEDMGRAARALDAEVVSSVCRDEGLAGVARCRPGVQALLRGLALLVVGGIVGSGQGVEAAESPCANEALRAAQSATFLPNCRAFELVSPSQGTPYTQPGTHDTLGARASNVGNAIAWFSFYPLSSSIGGGFHNISTRGATGWSSEAVGPQLSSTNNGFSYCEPLMFFSEDLSTGILMDGRGSSGPEQAAVGECPGNDPALVAHEPKGFQNVFIRDSATDTYALANITPEGETPSDAVFQYASDDFSHVVFEEDAKLTESAPIGATLYEWVAGAAHLITVLPNGTPTGGSSPAGIVGGVTHPVSANGTRVVFNAQGKLFLRENATQDLESAPSPGGECLESAKACTIQLDTSQAGGSGGGGSFLAADKTDTRIYFTDGSEAKLTADTGNNSGQHLYEYDTETGKLADLTPAGQLELDGLSGISEDGAYVYVVAQAVLDAEATAGKPNLYVFHEDTVQFVATLGAEDQEDARDWKSEELTARISPNGHYFAFNSIEKLTGYENAPKNPEDCIDQWSIAGAESGPCMEIFLYDYDAPRNKLQCVSCALAGELPTGPAGLQQAEASNPNVAPVYMQRNVLDDGTVLFDTANGLLGTATNGVSNVYQYQGGKRSLISSATSESNSFFYDASADGQNIFFVTTEHLLPSDTDNGMRLYDARVDGGFSEAEAPVRCSAEGCRPQVDTGLVGSTTWATTAVLNSGNLQSSKTRGTVLARRQMLERALRSCREKKNKHRRTVCVRRARKRFAGSSKPKSGASK